MAVTSSAKEWINRQTAIDKLSIGLVWLTLPDCTSIYGAFKLAVTAVLAGWTIWRGFKHKEAMSNFET